MVSIRSNVPFADLPPVIQAKHESERTEVVRIWARSDVKDTFLLEFRDESKVRWTYVEREGWKFQVLY